MLFEQWAGCEEADSDPCFEGCGLGPSVKTGASVPGYSGGFAAAWLFCIRLDDHCLNGRSVCELLARAPHPVGLGPGFESMPSYPCFEGCFCSRGSLTPVAAPNVSPNDFLGDVWRRISGGVWDRIPSFASDS